MVKGYWGIPVLLRATPTVKETVVPFRKRRVYRVNWILLGHVDEVVMDLVEKGGWLGWSDVRAEDLDLSRWR